MTPYLQQISEEILKERRCSKCSELKKEILFAIYNSIKGFRGICKRCDALRSRKNYEKHREKILVANHNYYLKKKNTKEYKKKETEIKLSPKYKARYLLRSAVESGKVTKKNCEECADSKSQAHHPDYKKPFAVKWLCKKHHSEAHRKYK